MVRDVFDLLTLQFMTYKVRTRGNIHFTHFQVNISLVKDKLIVKHVNTSHENHQADENTYQAYPENVRLTEKNVTGKTNDCLRCK